MNKIFQISLFVLFCIVNHFSYGQEYAVSTKPIFLPYAPSLPSGQINNEMEPSEEGKNENIHCNPILLDGKLLDYNDLSLQSTGRLKLMVEDPLSPEATPISFTIQLRRNGVILNDPAMNFMSQEMKEVEISSVLQFAETGDHLIINPVKTKYWKAKRILKFGGC